MKRWQWAAVLIIAAGSGFVYSWVSNKEITAQSFAGETIIRATPTALWAILNDPARLCSISDQTLLAGKTTFAKIGDASRVHNGADTGMLIVTLINPPHELRLTFEPQNGSYVCQQRWVLNIAGDSTKVTYLERYTESGVESSAQIEATRKGFDDMLSRLAKMAGAR